MAVNPALAFKAWIHDSRAAQRLADLTGILWQDHGHARDQYLHDCPRARING